MDNKKKLNPQYQKKIEQIKLDAEDYTDEEMQPVYTQQKQSLDALHAMIGLLFIKYAVDGLLKVNPSQKASITNQFDIKLKSMGKNLGTSEVKTVTDILSQVYKDTYNKTAYTMDSGLKVDLKFNILKPEFIDSVVNSEFKGEMFSNRIWKNKSDMMDMLKSGLLEAMKGNTSIDKLGRDIQTTFNTTAYQSQRLVHTEMARVQSQASDDIGHNTGVKQQMYTATLDNKTSPECAALDGTIYDIDDPDKVIPPENHPNCRCVLQNMIDGWTPSVRKDNITKEIIPYQTYAQWKSDKGIDDED